MPAAVQGPTVGATNGNSPLPSQWLVAQRWCCWWVSKWQGAHEPIVWVFGFYAGIYQWNGPWIQMGSHMGSVKPGLECFIIGRQQCNSIQMGINLRSLPYADRDKHLIPVHMELCAQTVKLTVCCCVCLGRAHDRDGPALSTFSVECHHECHSGRQGRGSDIAQVQHLIMKWIHCTHLLQASSWSNTVNCSARNCWWNHYLEFAWFYYRDLWD